MLSTIYLRVCVHVCVRMCVCRFEGMETGPSGKRTKAYKVNTICILYYCDHCKLMHAYIHAGIQSQVWKAIPGTLVRVNITRLRVNISLDCGLEFVCIEFSFPLEIAICSRTSALLNVDWLHPNGILFPLQVPILSENTGSRQPRWHRSPAYTFYVQKLWFMHIIYVELMDNSDSNINRCHNILVYMQPFRYTACTVSDRS